MKDRAPKKACAVEPGQFDDALHERENRSTRGSERRKLPRTEHQPIIKSARGRSRRKKAVDAGIHKTRGMVKPRARRFYATPNAARIGSAPYEAA
jgi:hypothetical protein